MTRSAELRERAAALRAQAERCAALSDASRRPSAGVQALLREAEQLEKRAKESENG